ncbi:MAG TPA: cell wall hydrolase [Sphingomicrobium sp.]|nr:cell wall hydrolase [Sphingomicrobium sp.]
MFHRFAVLIAGIALAAGSVAPAQVTPYSVQPVTAMASNDVLPPVTPVTPAPLLQSPQRAVTADPLAPVGDDEQPAPEVSRKAALSDKVAELRSAETTSREIECLAVGVYFEAKSEPLPGQLAVAQVIANRANSKGQFPSSYCGVLFQRGQFSFVRGGRWPAVAKSGTQWKNAVAIARIVDQQLHDGPVPKALFFHARRVSPGWKLTRVATVGNHVFYR